MPQSASFSGLRRFSPWLLLCLFNLAPTAQAELPATTNSEIEQGKRIYMEGVLPSGSPLKGRRQNSGEVEGAAAACETCHRPSGMGSLEGNIVAPPITGRFLFSTADNRPTALLDTRAPKNVTRAHAPYDEKSLAKAIREGINIDGKPMSPLMPRYVLNDTELKALSAYLMQLNAEFSPGVGEDSLRFATIVAPGVDPKQRKVMEDMMRAAFSQRNSSQQVAAGRMRMPIDLIPRTSRDWELTVWELKGAPETWGAQLAEYYRREPVFAVISGLSNSTWAPVHTFCQQEKLPCILPSVALPPMETGFYPLYYSRGLALEADVLAKKLREQGPKAPRRLIQIYRDDEVGRGATQALAAALRDSGIAVESRVLGDPKAALTGVSGKDAVMLWLHPSDMSVIGKAMGKQLPAISYVSGFLVEDDFSFVSKAWKPTLRVVYPYELGDKRRNNVITLEKWLNSWGLPLVNQAFQSEVFFNLLFLTDMTSQMLDNLYRDYMIERAEDMLSAGSNVSAYPHLSMARGQRFASKGAYITHLDKEGKLAADSEWIVP